MSKAAIPDPSGDSEFMLSLARGLHVMRAFEGHASLSVAEVVRISELTRGSVGRCLHTLEKLGYVRERGGRYTLTSRLLPLACGFLTSTPLATASQAIANRLRDGLQETVSIGTLDTMDPGRMIYIARAERNQVIAAPLTVGSTLPSHCTSMGRVMLAALDEAARDEWLAEADLNARTTKTVVDKRELADILREVAAQRYCLVEEELEIGLRSLAVPVRDQGGLVVAALNVATFSHAHTSQELLDRFLPELRAAAGQLERVI